MTTDEQEETHHDPQMPSSLKQYDLEETLSFLQIHSSRHDMGHMRARYIPPVLDFL